MKPMVKEVGGEMHLKGAPIFETARPREERFFPFYRE
jgi:hypothetical protein